MLDKHNELRRKVSKGQQAGQPPAANMRKMVWNTELEGIAQRWADQCTFDNDELRIKKDLTSVGQNGYVLYGAFKLSKEEVQKSLVFIPQAWYDEVTNPGVDLKTITKFRQVFSNLR